MRRGVFVWAAATALLLSLQTARQARAGEPAHDRLVEEFKKEWLSVGLVLQVVGDAQDERTFPGENGFSIANARVSLSGELDGGFGYFVQGNFVDSPALLDGQLYFRVRPSLFVDAGLFKAPFSAEFLIPAQSIDFVNRSRTVSALAPGREIGVQLRGSSSSGLLGYRVGMFNGNRFEENANDNGRFLYAGRLEIRPPALRDAESRGNLSVAVNAATSEDTGADLAGGLLPDFEGRRDLAGIDLRFTRHRLLLSAEAIRADLEPTAGPAIRPSGFHLTAGYGVGKKSQVLARWDRFSADGPDEDVDLLVLGYNLWPTQVTEVQVNWLIPERGGIDSHQLLVNFQLSF